MFFLIQIQSASCPDVGVSTCESIDMESIKQAGQLTVLIHSMEIIIYKEKSNASSVKCIICLSLKCNLKTIIKGVDKPKCGNIISRIPNMSVDAHSFPRNQTFVQCHCTSLLYHTDSNLNMCDRL